jgi:hypothetical protein
MGGLEVGDRHLKFHENRDNLVGLNDAFNHYLVSAASNA